MADPVYKLLINDQPVSKPNMVSLSVRYNEPRELTFTLDKAVGLHSRVKLYIDGALRFDGRLLREQPDLEGRQDQYVAMDLSEDSDAVQILKWKRVLAVGALWAMWYGRYTAPLSEILDEIAAAAGDDLRARGIVGDTVFGGDCGGDVPSMELQPANFRDFLEAILSGVAGMRWVYVPATDGGYFRIVNTLTAPVKTLSIPAQYVESLPITRSLEGRYSRVQIEPMVFESAGMGSTLLLPAWDRTLEANWSMDIVGPMLVNQVANPLADVYRKWSYAHLPYRQLADTTVELLQYVERFPGDGAPQIIPVDIEYIDQVNKLVWSKMPLLRYYLKRRGAANVHVPGRVQMPYAAALRYWYIDDHQMVAPEVGPEGTAYSLYGLDRTLRVQETDVANVTEARAREILSMVKDVLISGTIAALGPVPSWLWDLGCRLNVTANGQQTGLESAQAIVSGFVHQFSEQRTDIELTTDRSAYAGRAMP
jgi:hypothetical protein